MSSLVFLFTLLLRTVLIKTNKAKQEREIDNLEIGKKKALW